MQVCFLHSAADGKKLDPKGSIPGYWANDVKQTKNGTYIKIGVKSQRGETCNPTHLSMILKRYNCYVSVGDLKGNSDDRRNERYKYISFQQKQLKEIGFIIKSCEYTTPQEFAQIIKNAIDNGILLSWSCNLYNAPEYDISNAKKSAYKRSGSNGHHARIINGYIGNQIIYGDTWGAGEKRKEMYMRHAYDMTTYLAIVYPENTPQETIDKIIIPKPVFNSPKSKIIAVKTPQVKKPLTPKKLIEEEQDELKNTFQKNVEKALQVLKEHEETLQALSFKQFNAKSKFFKYKNELGNAKKDSTKISLFQQRLKQFKNQEAEYYLLYCAQLGEVTKKRYEYWLALNELAEYNGEVTKQLAPCELYVQQAILNQELKRVRERINELKSSMRLDNANIENYQRLQKDCTPEYFVFCEKSIQVLREKLENKKEELAVLVPPNQELGKKLYMLNKAIQAAETEINVSE